MTPIHKLITTLAAALVVASGFAGAQETTEAEAIESEAVEDEAAEPVDETDDYVAVWSVIERQWEAVERGNRNWVEEYLSADFIGWPKNSPAPQDKASTRRWTAFSDQQSKGIEHELYPLSTVIHGDTAVAHYLYTNATENKDGETEVNNGRFTDVLVRIDGQWKFIAWHGGDDDSDD